MIDLSKLSRAEDWKTFLPLHQHGKWLAIGPARDSLEEAKADRDFNGLAREAFDVIMRRDWHARRVYGSVGKWCVYNSRWNFVSISLPYALDPFTALVEADAWYKANVEGVPA